MTRIKIAKLGKYHLANANANVNSFTVFPINTIEYREKQQQARLYMTPISPIVQCTPHVSHPSIRPSTAQASKQALKDQGQNLSSPPSHKSSYHITKLSTTTKTHHYPQSTFPSEYRHQPSPLSQKKEKKTKDTKQPLHQIPTLNTPLPQGRKHHHRRRRHGPRQHRI